jgi:hypothetical protein
MPKIARSAAFRISASRAFIFGHVFDVNGGMYGR